MSDLIERMCFYYDQKAHELAGSEYVCRRDRAKHIAAMRHALASIREPSEAMINAYENQDYDATAIDTWRAMIDEALK